MISTPAISLKNRAPTFGMEAGTTGDGIGNTVVAVCIYDQSQKPLPSFQSLVPLRCSQMASKDLARVILGIKFAADEIDKDIHLVGKEVFLGKVFFPATSKTPDTACGKTCKIHSIPRFHSIHQTAFCFSSNSGVSGWDYDGGKLRTDLPRGAPASSFRLLEPPAKSFTSLPVDSTGHRFPAP